MFGVRETVYSLFLCQAIKKKMQTIVYRESQIWEIKEDIYTKSLTKNQVYAIFHMQDIWKNVLRKLMYKALYGGAMLVSL